MNKNGQLHLEAIICFGVFIALLSASAAVLAEQAAMARGASDAVHAYSEALACSIVTDSMFANSSKELEGVEFRCFSESRHFVSGKADDARKDSYSIAENIQTSGQGKMARLEVEVLEHYG